MNKLLKKVKEKSPYGWELLYEKIGYSTSYKVTSHLHEDLEKATFTKMEAWEIREWARVLEVEPSFLICECRCGYKTLSQEEINNLIKHEGIETDISAHAA
jgi:hypothetical protein